MRKKNVLFLSFLFLSFFCYSAEVEVCRPRAVSEEPAPDWSTRVRSSWVLVSMSPTRFFLFFFVFFFTNEKTRPAIDSAGRRDAVDVADVVAGDESSRVRNQVGYRSRPGSVHHTAASRRRDADSALISRSPATFVLQGNPRGKKKIKKNEKHNGATLFLRKPIEVNSIFRRYETSHSWTAKNRKLDDFLWSFFFVLVYLFLSYGVCRVWMEVSSIGFNKKKVQPKKKIAEKMTKSLISPSTHWLLAAFFFCSRRYLFFLFLHEGCRRLFVCVCVFFCV